MTGRASILALLGVVAALGASCKSHDPIPPGEQPTIESLGPPRCCFPTRQPDNRWRPSAGTLPTTAPAQ